MDIIGCHHPVELILAKAHARCRRHSIAAATRDQAIAEQRISVEEKRDFRLNWNERKQISIKHNSRREQWLKMIALANFHSKIISCLDNEFVRAAKIIRKWYIKERARRLIVLDDKLAISIIHLGTTVRRSVSTQLRYFSFQIFNIYV